jgi:hypothetical protein
LQPSADWDWDWDWDWVTQALIRASPFVCNESVKNDGVGWEDRVIRGSDDRVIGKNEAWMTGNKLRAQKAGTLAAN